MNGIFFCNLLLIVIHFGFSAKIVKVKTAFLYENLEEDIYVKWPQGMTNVSIDDSVIWNQCIYGLIQAARKYYKKAIEIFKKAGFIGGNVDPCL